MLRCLGWVLLISGFGVVNGWADDHQVHDEKVAPVQMEEVVVTAARVQEFIDDHPQQVTVMTRENIEQGGYSDLQQVLNNVPGVDVQKSGGGFGSRISIRGSGGGSKILFLINGRPANSSQYGGIDLESIPLDMVQRVEVFRPPVPVWLGAGATSGAVNIVLAGASSRGKEDPKDTRIVLMGGSFGKAGVTASQSMKIKEHQLRLNASADHRDGNRTNSDGDNANLSFQWDLPGSETAACDVNGRYYQSEHGSPGPTTHLTPDARQSYKKGSLDVRIQHLSGQRMDTDVKTYLDIVRLEDQSQSGLVSILDTLTYGVKNETSWNSEDKKQTWRVTAKLAQDMIEHTLSGDHHRVDAFLGLQGDRRFDAATVSLGGRCDYTSDFYFHPAINGGVSIPLGDRNQIKVNAGYSVNVPTFGQLYQPSHGSIDQARGNPDLDEERVWTVSTGFSHRFGKDSAVEITLFHEDTGDKIVYQEGVDLIKRPVNIDGAWRQGVETVMSWKPVPSLSIDLSHVWQQSRNREFDTTLSYTPEQKFKATLNWIMPTRTRMETTVAHVGHQFSDLENTSEKDIDSYTTVNLKMIQPIAFKKCPMEVIVFFENLLDQDYEVHYGYPDDGFRITASLKLDF